jgi:two-component system sensor histidine kinase GlrK
LDSTVITRYNEIRGIFVENKDQGRRHMNFSIFFRLVIGFLIIFLLLVSAIVYALQQLGRFDNIAYSIQSVDNQIIEYHRLLTDNLLAELRYEKRYIISGDQSLYEEFQRSRKSFTETLGRMNSVVTSGELQELLSSIGEAHRKFAALFENEAALHVSGKPYPKEEFERNKEMYVDRIADGLTQLKTHARGSTYEKLSAIIKAGEDSRDLAFIIAGIAVILGMLISVWITRSITRPLTAMKKKIRTITAGDFSDDLTVNGPPEIEALGGAFNYMCRRLRELDRMKADFFSLMSHELRTPLSSIKEGTNLLLEGMGGVVSEQQKRLLFIIGEESNRLIQLVNSLLDLSKIESGMMQYYFVPADLPVLIQRAVSGMIPLAEAKGIKFDMHMDEPLPPVKLDEEKILQVLRNLLGNAIKFSPEKSVVRITARIHSNMAEVSVEDKGIGIEPEQLEAIFEKFKQASLAGPNKIQGTGLGLAIVRHVITAHGGKVWAESEPGKGSTFIFALPV